MGCYMKQVNINALFCECNGHDDDDDDDDDDEKASD